MRHAPDGGSAVGIWGPDHDDGSCVCPDCGERKREDHMVWDDNDWICAACAAIRDEVDE